MWAAPGEGCNVNADIGGNSDRDVFGLPNIRPGLAVPTRDASKTTLDRRRVLRQAICWSTTCIVVALAAITLIAWYVAVGDERGLYDQPWQRATSVLWHISLLTNAWWFSPALYFSGGVAVTLWAGGSAARRRTAEPSTGDLSLTNVTNGRLAVIDVFSGFLEMHMRAAAERGQTILAALPKLMEDGTAEQELMAYANAAAQDFADLQRLTRLYRKDHRDLTDIVAVTMEFNYFEVVSAARALAGVLGRTGRSQPGAPQTLPEARRKDLQALESALQALEIWIATRERLFAAMRGMSAGTRAKNAHLLDA